ncbi:hypothetical protein HPP92_001648 [Vanilla planifolia]|uniref:pyruvate dehydrogenase (acetyl-transferring) n=1 Tax=Vanilla planifolia TaxID=51239 RepID=A0A835S092_VANPL|nr:hypothetical protein HPP92_001648 [Vanilla planifolia]
MAAALQVTANLNALTSGVERRLRLESMCRSAPVWHKSLLIVKPADRRSSINRIMRYTGARLITNAVAAKTEASASSTASKPGHEVLLFEALREGLEEEMERDPRVCIIGEDVGHYGGSYKVTKDLANKFGDLRVLDTPIAENSFTGMGIGAAMTGLRPVIEGMNMGFLLLAFNQISNNCGMLHYTSGGQFTIPVVIRGPGGVGRQLGAEHSQRLESYFQSIPGIQMVACSTPYNAKGLMKAAIRSENPVVLFEHVLLYNLKERIPDEDYVLCLEEAEMVRPGDHVTILTYSRMRYHVMQAAKTLVNKGYDPEVIDIRSLKPFDLHTIGNSIKKTHRVLIVEECMRTGGIGASLRSAIVDNFGISLMLRSCLPVVAGRPDSICRNVGRVDRCAAGADCGCRGADLQVVSTPFRK